LLAGVKSTGEDVIQSFSEEVDEKSQVDVDDDACNDEDVSADGGVAWR
jgi:hypothetical protein